MIDYFSLALGHGLLAIALLRLVMREELDVDPHIQSFVDALRARRDAASVAGRNASRRGQSQGHDDAADNPQDQDEIT
ncbi:hypothetical protein EH30_14015 [Erythrobacter sp. JL475]|nr:hypothetical protein EH30_14015 [Erythrobacter sp. JL475]